GDYENDGDLDILLSGVDSGDTPNSQVWRKNGDNTFTNINAGLTGVVGGSVWGDYDNDGDLDILLSGQDSGFDPALQVWRNNGDDAFTNINAGLTGVILSSVAWGDYDNDGDLDILLSGQDSDFDPVLQVWRNNGDDTFANINAGLMGLSFSSIAWGDYDNDGDLDILLSGQDSDFDPVSQVWRNNGDDTFANINVGLTDVEGSSVAWGDYDNDGDLDILLSGFDRDGNRVSQVWRNEDCLPDLSLSKTVTPAIAAPGNTITYTLTFSNIGSITATGVIITDSVPISVTNVSVVNNGVTITDTGASPAYAWQVANLSPNEGGVITLTGTLNNLSAAGVFTNTAKVTAIDDSNPANNTAKADIAHCGNIITVVNANDSGSGSLRQAIDDVCPNGVINFNLTYPVTISLSSAELDIGKPLTIQGPGRDNLAISGDDSYRVIDIEIASTEVVTLTNLTIRDGHTYSNGGGIWFGDGRLYVSQVDIIDNYADTDGGGVYISDGNAVLTATNIISNSAHGDGGGLTNKGVLTITHSLVEGNETDNYSGGGLDNNNYMVVANSVISGNIASDAGGGLDNDSGNMLILTDVTISYNTADGDGSGIRNYEGIITGTRVTVNHNDDEGIENDGGDITLINATLSHNEEGLYNNNGGTAHLRHVTVTANDEEGIYLTNDSGQVYLQNSLIVNNGREDLDVASSGDDTDFVSLGYNIIGNVFRVNFSTNTTGDLYGDNRHTTTPNAGATEIDGVVDARLGPLTDHGGHTQTHAPQMWSPAINHIPNGQSGCGSNFVIDQRGVSRPFYGGCDAGAYEHNGATSLWLKKRVDDYNPSLDQLLRYDIILKNVDLTAAHTGVTVSDILPAQLTPEGQVSVSGGSGGTIGTAPTLVSALTIAAGEVVTVSFDARVANDAALVASRIANTVQIHSDQQLGNISAEAVIRIKPIDSDRDGIADPVDTAPTDPAVPSTYPPQVYITYTDNENNEGSGIPDGDMAPQDIRPVNPVHPIEFNIWVDKALPQQNALLSILSEDVDWEDDEINEVYLNGHKLKEMVGEDDLINSTLFVIPDTSWVKLGNNLVQLEVNVIDDSTWSTTVYNGQLITDFSGAPIGEASIRTLNVITPIVGYSETLTVAMEVDTTAISQTVRLELVLRDADGTAIAFDNSSAARAWTVYGNNDEPHQWSVTLPSDGVDGIWTLTAAVYDIESSKFSDYQSAAVAVPDTSSAAPVVGGISPSQGYRGAAVVITGTNFVPGSTACTVGNVALQNQIIIDGNTVTGNIANTVIIGSQNVICTTSYGVATLTDGFTVLNRPPLGVPDSGTTNEDTALVISPLSNDYDADDDTLFVATVGNPLHGTTSISGNTQLVYTPLLNYTGSDSFFYIVSDGLLTDTVTVNVTIEAVNDLPTANDDHYLSIKNYTTSLPLLENDTDVEDDDLSITLLGTPDQGGSLSLVNNQVSYTPATDFIGTETFTYTASDGHNGTGQFNVDHSDIATVTVIVVEGDKGITTDLSNGGTLTYDGTTQTGSLSITVHIPAGQLSASAALVYTVVPTDSHTTPAGLIPASTFNLEVYLNTILQPGFTFTQPLTLTIDYDEADLAHIPQGENDLQLLAWNGSGWDSNGIVLINHNTDTNQITFQISQATTFALFGRANPVSHSLYLPIIANADPAAMPDLVVDSVSINNGQISVVIRNAGNGSITDAFWVDAYFNPTETPSLNKGWPDIAPAGIIWGVTKDVIVPNETIILTIGDQYYFADRSSSSFPTDATIYILVDSINYDTAYGNVQESDESNNLGGPTSGSITGQARSSSVSGVQALITLPVR
ncbi:MAG: Ig-like domain-containing protein, partial [Chloroflexota bacterium]